MSSRVTGATIEMSDVHADFDDGGVLHCLDRRGRSVTLSALNWDEKILLDHAEMIGCEGFVASSIESPDLHARDRVFSNREVYYRWAILPPPDDDRYLKVVVAYYVDDTGIVAGRVVTAYAVDFLPRGETRLWTRPGFNPHSHW
jgi:hypothetical protein